MSRSQLLVLIFVLLLMFLNVTSTTILIPSYSMLVQLFNISPASIYLADAAFMLTAAIFSVIWGYTADKINKKIVILLGSAVSTIGFFISYFVNSFLGLIIARAISGCGMGMVFPIGFSIITDLVPSTERNGWFAFLAIFGSLANGLGNSLAAFSTFGWQSPFLILGGISIIVFILLGVIAIPRVGAQDEEMKRLQAIVGADYEFHVTRKDLPMLIKKPTNRYLILTSFFQIIPGTVIVYALIMTFANPDIGLFRYLPSDIRTEISTIVSGLVGVGFIIGNAIMAKLGDKSETTNKRGRAKITLIAIALATPLLLIMVSQMTVLSPEFVASQNYPTPMPGGFDGIWLIVTTIVGIFGAYPQYILFLICALLGSYFAAAPSTGKNAVMVDVNLPEHRGTITSLVQNGENIGKTVTLLLLPELILWVNNYQLLLFISILFYLPGILFWYLIYRHVGKDLQEKELTLQERTQASLLDYFTAMDKGLDQAMYLMEDAKRLLVRKPKKAGIVMDMAIELFKSICNSAESNHSEDIAQRAMNLLNQALFIKSDLLMLSRKPTLSRLDSLVKKIDSIWEKSELGTLEAISEEAYLKVYEARLKAHFNPIETLQLLSSAIEMYTLIIHTCEEKISENEAKRQSSIEVQRFKHITQIMENATKWRDNTIQLQNQIEEIINKIVSAGITKKELESIIALHEEYQVELPEIAEESFDKVMAKQFQKLVRLMDQSFIKYDRWNRD